MIDFRYHIVSLVAVFLALALGLFLGSTTLQSTVTHNLRNQARSVIDRNHVLQSQNDLLNGQLKHERDFMTSAEPYAVRGQLTGETVAVVSAPGVDGGDRDALVTTLTDAGATVTAQVQLNAQYLDPTQDVEFAALAKELAHGARLPRANGAVQAGAELARALITKPTRQPLGNGRVQSILSVLSDGKMLSVTSHGPVRPAAVAVLLTAPPATNAPTKQVAAANTTLLGLAGQLRSAGSGAVLAGPTLVPDVSDDAVTAARADASLSRRLSTVDADDEAAGQVAVVYGLVASTSGHPGAFGLSGSPPLPAPTSTP